MRFNKLLATLATAAVAYGQCGHECDPNRKPSQPLTANLVLVAKKDQTYQADYQIGGTVTIINDCKFKVDNFYFFPSIKPARWMGTPVGATEGIGLTKLGSITPIDPSQPQTVEYDVSDVDPFCKASLLDDVSVIGIYDSDYQTLATAQINPGATGGKSDSKKDSGKSSSDANTCKWSMALFGLTTLAGYLLY